MSKHVRKILPLLLCLLLMACLLPAAYAADGSVDVTTLAELKTALANNTAKIYVYQDITLDASLTIPESCYVKVRQGSTFTVPQNMTLTINGKIEASYDGRIDVLGTLQNNGEIEMFGGGVVDVKGTYAHADGRPITFNRNGNPDAAMPKFIVEQGAVCTLNLFRTQEGLVAADVLEGINPNAYSCHSNYDRENHVVKDTRVYYPSSRVGLGGMAQRGLAYIEVHGLDTYTLSEDVEIPVFENTPAKVDMHATKLVVPAGKSVLVNGTLAVRELVIESGGSVTVNGYLDAVNGITLNNGGTLTVNNTHIDAGYVPTTDIEALKNIVYNGDADLLLHLVVWPSDNVSNAIRTASDAVDDHVNCMVELRTDWTVAEAFDAHLITLRVRKGSTLTVNNVLTVKDLVVDDGGKLVFGDGGSISYAAEKTEVEVGSFSQLQATVSAFSQQHEQDPTARVDAYTSGDFTITGNFTIPDGFQLRCGNNLTIAANAVVTVDGKLDAIEGGHVSILGTVINNNQFRMFDTGVMELSGTLVNNHDVCYKRVSTDRMHLVINSGATFTNNSNFAIADDLVRDPAVLGVDVDGYCVARMWDEPDMSRYFAPEVFDHFEGMCSSGKFVYLELHGIEEISVTEDMHIAENMTVEMGETTLVVPSGFTLTVNGELTVKELQIENGGTVDVKGTLDAGRPVVLGRSGQPQGVLPQLIIENGATFTPGSFHIYNNVNAAEAVQGIDLSQYSYHKNYDRTNRVIRDDRVYYLSSRAGIEDMANRALGYIEIHGLDTYTLSTDIEIPVFDGTTPARVDMSETTLVVPSGRTLTVNGELIVMALVNDGGNVVIGAGGSISYPDRVEVTTLAKLKAALNANISRIIVTQNIALDADLTIPESCYVKVRHDSTLTVPAGKTLTINGKLEASFNGRIDVLGTLQNNGEIEMFDGGVVDVKGTYAHADGRPITFNRDGRQDAAMPKFIVEQGAVYTLNMFRTDEGLVAADVLVGINPNTYSCHSNYDRDKHVIREMRIYYPSSRVGLGGMAQRGLAYIEVHGLDSYTLSEDVEIPVFDTTPAKVDMRDTKLVVPSGKTLTVNGELAVKELVIEQGATVKLNQGGELRSAGSMTISDGCDIIVDNAWIHGGYSDGVSLNALKTASFTGDAGIHLYFNFDKPEKVQSTLKKAADAAAANVGHIDSVVYARYNWTITDDLTLPERVQVEVRVGRDGGIVINEGATLTIPESSTLLVAGTDLRLNGTLANNGTVLLGADVVPGSKGIYCGSGSVEYMGQPYAIYNSKSAADMILPEALTALESQALADGVFTSVYIPAGIQSIASDAFGNKTGLIILAEPGSKGAEFAAAKNYLFAPVAPAA